MRQVIAAGALVFFAGLLAAPRANAQFYINPEDAVAAPALQPQMAVLIAKSKTTFAQNFRTLEVVISQAPYRVLGTTLLILKEAEKDKVSCSDLGRTSVYAPLADGDCVNFGFLYRTRFALNGQINQIYVYGLAYQQKSTGRIVGLDLDASGVRCDGISCD